MKDFSVQKVMNSERSKLYSNLSNNSPVRYELKFLPSLFVALLACEARIFVLVRYCFILILVSCAEERPWWPI